MSPRAARARGFGLRAALVCAAGAAEHCPGSVLPLLIRCCLQSMPKGQSKDIFNWGQESPKGKKNPSENTAANQGLSCLVFLDRYEDSAVQQLTQPRSSVRGSQAAERAATCPCEQTHTALDCTRAS